MRTRTCLERNIGAVAKSLESGHWQPSQFGQERSFLNVCFRAVQRKWEQHVLSLQIDWGLLYGCEKVAVSKSI